LTNEFVYEVNTNSKKIVEVVEIETSVGTFLCGTWEEKCCLFDFKDRKSINKILNNKSQYFTFNYDQPKTDLHLEIERQIKLYLQGKLEQFMIPIVITGTNFQKKVWNKLMEIPYGSTISYGELASSIGNRKAMRAVGAANGANSIAVIIPCHRVIRADGHLQGYGGGLWRKKRLLDLEIDVKTNSNQQNLLDWIGWRDS